ncbi:MAG: HD domain-containing protein, partial [Ignisphaera sp.]
MSSKKLVVLHQTPIIHNNNIMNYSEITQEEFLELLKKFQELIEAAKQVAVTALKDLNICRDLQGVERAICALSVLADAISIVFRRYFMVPLLPPRIYHDSFAQQPTINDFIYLWVIARDGDRKDITNVLDELVSLWIVKEHEVKKLEEYAYKLLIKSISQKIKPIPANEEEAIDRLKLLMNIPADTRPGCSISKLIPHLLTTAGLAYVIYLSDSVSDSKNINVRDRLHLAILRLAALLHDVGKPNTWYLKLQEAEYSHAEASVKLLENLKFVDEYIAQEFNLREAYEIIKIIIKHHHGSPPQQIFKVHNIGVDVEKLIKVLRDADIASSSMDRLGEVFAKASEAVLKDIANQHKLSVEDLFIRSGEEVRKIWDSLEYDKLLDVVKSIANKINPYSIPQELLDCKSWGWMPKAKVLVLDVAGIQKFIKRESIRILIAASTLIDLVTVFAIPKAVIETLRISLDNIIYAGGGFAIMLVPSWVTEKHVDIALDNVKKFLGPDISLEINYAISNLSSSWPCTIREAIARLTTNKSLRRNLRSKAVATGYEVLCDWCGRRVATNAQHNEYVCNECLYLFRLGEKMYINHKLSILGGSGYRYAHDILENNKKLAHLYQYFMEWLSGVELEDLPGTRRSIAIVKADGNAAGVFMASAINITEAMCRSIRMDMGMKMGIAVALNKVLEMSETINLDRCKAEAYVSRLYTGLLYSGGDDMMAIWPSSLAIPVALSIAKTFWKIMGGAV